MKITVSAPGKLMLFGEHAVVYGRPCLVTAVGQRMRATVELTNEPIFQLNAPDVNVTDYQKPMNELGKGDIPKGARFVETALLNFFKKYPVKDGVKVTTKSEFNSQFGFGGSSASTVCVIKALSELADKKLSNKQVFNLSYQTVLEVQGQASGFDVAAATFGGTLYYVIGGKVLQSLNLTSLSLIVGYSGIKADTVTLVNQVKVKAKKYPWIIENTYDQMGKIADLAKKALLKGDLQTAGELMNFNQGYLAVLGVSSGKLESMIHAAREAGAYGAKLSGAGGGDCIIALAPSNKKKGVEKAIEKVGGKIINVKTNVEGVKIESSD